MPPKGQIIAKLTQNSDVILNSINTAITSLRDEIKNVNIETNEKILKLTDDMSEKFDSIESDVEILKKRNNANLQELVPKVIPLLKEAIEKEGLLNSNTNSEEITELEKAVDRIERLSRSKNIVIDGIPLSDKENLFDICSWIGSSLNVPVKDGDIDTVFRIKSTSKIQSIIVCFFSKYQRDRFLESYTKKQLKLSDIGWTGTDSRIFLNEHLTMKYSKLYKMARKLKSETKDDITKCFTMNGIPNIVINQKVIKIFCEADILQVKLKLDDQNVKDDDSTQPTTP